MEHGAADRGHRLLFYFNGFNSAIPADWSDNAKITGVEDFARREAFRFLPCTVDYRRAHERSEEILGRVPAELGDRGRVIFSGSSMGGWFARIMQLLLAESRPGLVAEALAFNPAFDLARHGRMLLGPQVNFVTGEHYLWTADDCDRLGQLEQAVDYDAPLPFYVYVDKGDEIIDSRASAARHSEIARFHAFEGGSHRFEHVCEALADFTSARGAARG